MCPQSMFFYQKYENSQNISTDNCHFYSRELSPYIEWACFRNATKQATDRTTTDAWGIRFFISPSPSIRDINIDDLNVGLETQKLSDSYVHTSCSYGPENLLL